jgi:hypothetical protein
MVTMVPNWLSTPHLTAATHGGRPLLQCVTADFSALDKYLNKPETRKKLGVPKGRKYVLLLADVTLMHMVSGLMGPCLMRGAAGI